MYLYINISIYNICLVKVTANTPMPPILVALNERMRATAPALLCTFVASEANAIDYARKEGHYLGSHCDDRFIYIQYIYLSGG